MFPMRKRPNVVADRLTSVFEAHNIEANQIPRLLPSIQYKDLNSPKSLLAAITPEVVDATAQMFGIRREWLEGLDDLVYQVNWARGDPRTVLSHLAAGIAARGKARSWFPLRILTTSMKLERASRHQQWLLPVIVETVEELGETLVYRCHVFGNVYDWTSERTRMELKAISWVVHHQLNKPVPLIQVTPRELEQISMGQAVPSALWRNGLISEPSLEDFVLPQAQTMQAKETDELAKLEAYLGASGLKEFRIESPSLIDRTAIPEAEATREAEGATLASPEKSPQRVRLTGGKRQTQQASWDSILEAARTLWAEDKTLSIADVIRRVKAMSHLKAGALSDSAIHKRLRAVAPPTVLGKPGRKPK